MGYFNGSGQCSIYLGTMWNATLDGKGSLDTPITIGKSECGIGREGTEYGKE